MAVYELAPVTRVCLELDNFVVDAWPYNSGYVGRWYRDPGVGYTLETLFEFDLSPYLGTINSVQFRLVTDVMGSQTLGRPGAIFLNNKTAPGSWSVPPLFDDFSSSPWDTRLTNELTMLNPGTYLFDDIGTAFRNTVQQWIDTPSSNWGVVAACDFRIVGGWLGVTADSRLIIDIDETAEYPWKAVHRGVAQCVNQGVA